LPQKPYPQLAKVPQRNLAQRPYICHSHHSRTSSWDRTRKAIDWFAPVCWPSDSSVAPFWCVGDLRGPQVLTLTNSLRPRSAHPKEDFPSAENTLLLSAMNAEGVSLGECKGNISGRLFRCKRRWRLSVIPAALRLVGAFCERRQAHHQSRN